MTDDDLRKYLEWQRSRHAFEDLSHEWKEWAAAMIESAEFSGKGQMRPDDAELYLCRVLRVFDDLGDGMTEHELRGKFVSGLVLSGCPANPHASMIFTRALRDIEHSGFVWHEDHDWWEPGMRSGAGWVRLYKLTVAGQSYADAPDAISGPAIVEPSTCGLAPLGLLSLGLVGCRRRKRA